MKKSLKRYCIIDPIYNRHIDLFIGNRDLFNKKLDALKYQEFHAEGIGRTIMDFDRGHSIIWVANKDIPTLTHEIYHYACMLFDRAKLPLTVESDEVMAYYLGMTMKNILNKIKLK